MANYYVYICLVEREVKYVGMGQGERINHCTSGKSSCYELNKDYFAGKSIFATKTHQGLTKQEAAFKEAELIQNLGIDSLYNIKLERKTFNDKEQSIEDATIDCLTEIFNSLPDKIDKLRLQKLINSISKKYHYPARQLHTSKMLKNLMSIFGFQSTKDGSKAIFHRSEHIEPIQLKNHLKLLLN